MPSFSNPVINERQACRKEQKQKRRLNLPFPSLSFFLLLMDI